MLAHLCLNLLRSLRRDHIAMEAIAAHEYNYSVNIYAKKTASIMAFQ